MAAKQYFFFFFFFSILLFISSSNARDSKSFSKVTHRESVVSEIAQAPSPAEDISPDLYADQTQLTGPQYDDDQSHKTNNDNYYEYDQQSHQSNNNNNNYEYDEQSHQSNNNNNYEYDEQYYNEHRQGMSDTRFLHNDHDNYNYNNNNNDDDLYSAGETQRYEFDSMEEYQKYQDTRPYFP